MIRKKLSALSYGAGGEDPAKLFRHFDRDNSGNLDFGEFRSAIRKGAHITVAKMSDADLRKVFYAVDADDGGDVSLDELTEFIWGSGSTKQMRQAKRNQQKHRSKQRKLSSASPDAGFLKTTPSFERKVQSRESKPQGEKVVDGMPRFNLAALHVSADDTPGVGAYDLVRADTGSIAARAHAAKVAGQRRASSKPTSPRTPTIRPPSENEDALRRLRSGRCPIHAGEGAGGPVALGHTSGLAGKKHIITGRCTFNA